MTKKIKVLNICETARGGVGIYQNIIAGLAQRDIEMHHLVPEQDADFLDDTLFLHRFDRPRRGVNATAAMMRRFRRIVDTIDPDLCFFHSSFALACLVQMRARRDRRPALYCPHGWAVSNYPPDSARARLIRALEGRLSGLADSVVCVSKHEAAIARAHGYRGRFEVVENAVPGAAPDAKAGLFADEPSALHLLFVGRQDRQKGFDILARALEASGRADLRLHVIGGKVRDDGPDVTMPRAARAVGWVAHSEIDTWYRSADALIVPSRWEGLPLVIPEALRNGTPVLCSERSGMQDLITRGQTGDHFPLDERALTTLLRGLDKSALRRMRPACRAAFDARFTVDRMLDQLEALVRRMVHQDGAAARRRPA